MLSRTFAFGLVAALSLSAAVSLKKEGERKHAPDFELKDRAGKVVRLSDYAGKVVLLDFWATWCGPCKASMPWIDELSRQYRGAGLVVIGVSMDAEGWEVVAPFLEKVHVSYPIVIGNKRTAYLYGDVEALPLAFFVDQKQRVAAIHLGAATRKDFEKTIKALLDAPAQQKAE